MRYNTKLIDLMNININGANNALNNGTNSG